MTRIRFRCYHCGRVHVLDASAAGKRGRCLCGKVMFVPSVEDCDGETVPVACPIPERPEGETVSNDQEPGPRIPSAGRLALGALEVLGSFAVLGTADQGSKSKRGAVNTDSAIDLVPLALQLGATYVARGFSGLPDPNYLSLPADFWATLLFTLGALLLVDGRNRLRGPKR